MATPADRRKRRQPMRKKRITFDSHPIVTEQPEVVAACFNARGHDPTSVSAGVRGDEKAQSLVEESTQPPELR